jgi:hypothetical protein
MTHFDKLEISQDFDSIIVYLEAQASLMPDKISQKYLRMKSIVETMKKVKLAYNEIFRENAIYLNELIQKEYFTPNQIAQILEESKPVATPLNHLSREDALLLLASVRLNKPEVFDAKKHSHLIQKK